MTDTLNENGLQISTQKELIEALETGFKNIYGADANLESQTPDGQVINIFAQGGNDVRSLLLQLYNSFDPDAATGRILDQRCAINNIFRKGGTFTTVEVSIETDRTVTLEGVDENYNNPEATGFTIQDNAGNRFILVNTQTFNTGTHTALFRSENIGAVDVALNTLTNMVTVVLGVVSVNNPVAATLGVNEETDSQLRIRRRKSVAISSSGYLNGLLGAILALDGVTSAALYENYTNQTDSLGIPPHCIWLVVEGGSQQDIANTIYSKKSYGCDMRGNTEYTIITQSRQEFIAKWDEVVVQPLYIKFRLFPLAQNIQFDENAIKEYIIDNASFNIGDYAETAAITALCQEAINSVSGEVYGASQSGGVALDVLISSDNSTWVEYLEASAASKFAVAGVTIVS